MNPRSRCSGSLLRRLRALPLCPSFSAGSLLSAALLCVSLLCSGLSGPAWAATYAMPADPQQADRLLAQTSPILMVGKIVSAAQADAAGQAFTVYQLEAERVLKNAPQLALDAPLTLRLPGGVDEQGRELWLPGVPSFEQGERVLLALTPQLDPLGERVYGVTHLALGAFYEERLGDDHRIAVRRLTDVYTMGANETPKQVVRDFYRFADWLEAWSRWHAQAGAIKNRLSQEPDGDYWLPAPASKSGPTKTTSKGAAGAPRFRLSTVTVDGVPTFIRWPDFADTTVDFYLFETGQPSLPGGGVAQLRAALSAWNEASTSRIRYRYAGTTDADGGLSAYDAINTLLFENPNDFGGFTSPFICTDEGGGFGVLALGGPWFDRNAPIVHTFAGEQVLTTLSADIVTNTDSSCLLEEPSAAAEVYAHELGHTLGFAHPCGDNASGNCDSQLLDEALMRAFVHLDGRGASLGSDDEAAAAFLYPPLTACVDGASTLCLQQGRFRVEASWTRPDGTHGNATAVQLTPDTGYFWFFDPDNVELVVKVLDGCVNYQSYWVFAGGLTNVEVEMLVTDTLREVIQRYQNPQRTPFRPIQDTAAFATCP